MSEAIYVNNAGTSWPKAPGVVDACRESLAAPPSATLQLLQDAHTETCRTFGIDNPERLLLTGSCTAALALAFADLPLQTGDRVLTSGLEHHALARCVQQLSRTRGIVHEVAPYAPGWPLDLDFVRSALRRGDVKLVAVTAASNVTGELLPVEELGRLAHEYGVPLLLDAAQTACVVPIDLRTAPVDMLVFAAHKGPLAPHGLGGLWAAPHVEFQALAAVCEVGSSAQPAAVRCTSFPGACDAGSVNLAAAAGLVEALRWQQTQAGAAYERPRALAARLRQWLRERPGCNVFGGAAASYTATVSFTIAGLAIDRAEAYFSERGIALRAGQHCAPLALQSIGAPEGTLRVSFGPFNQNSDVDAIMAAVASYPRNPPK